MVSRVTAEETFGRAVAPARSAVGALAFIVVVVGVVVAAAPVAFGGRRVKLAKGGTHGVPQHVAAPALDESRAVAGDYEFSLFTKHEHSLLSGGFDHRVSSVHYGDQHCAGGGSENVCGILLPVRRHPEECGCE